MNRPEDIPSHDSYFVSGEIFIDCEECGQEHPTDECPNDDVDARADEADDFNDDCGDY